MRQAVVENPNTPPSVLQQLAKSKSISLRRQIANNSATTPKVFLNTIEDEDDTVLNLITLNPNATAPVLKELIQYCDFHNFKFILSPPNCTLEVKKRALNSWADKKSKINTNSIQIDKNYILFRLAVFFSPHAEPAVLASNARSIFWIERYAIAINPNTPNLFEKFCLEIVMLLSEMQIKCFDDRPLRFVYNILVKFYFHLLVTTFR